MPRMSRYACHCDGNAVMGSAHVATCASLCIASAEAEDVHVPSFFSCQAYIAAMRHLHLSWSRKKDDDEDRCTAW